MKSKGKKSLSGLSSGQDGCTPCQAPVSGLADIVLTSHHVSGPSGHIHTHMACCIIGTVCSDAHGCDLTNTQSQLADFSHVRVLHAELVSDMANVAVQHSLSSRCAG